MEIDITKIEGTTRIRVGGNVDEGGAETLKERFFEIEMADPQRVVVDFSGVTLIGSAGIGKLLLFYKQLHSTGGSLQIENVSEPIYELLRVLKLDTIVDISKAQEGLPIPAEASELPSSPAANACCRQ